MVTQTVTETANTVANSGGNFEYLIPVLLGSLVVSFIIGAFVITGIIIYNKIFKRINEQYINRNNLIWKKYQLDIQNLKTNFDPNFVRRLKRTFMLYKVGTPIYYGSKHSFLGRYLGHQYSKNGVYLMLVEIRHTFFKRFYKVMMIPKEYWDSDALFDKKTNGIYFNNMQSWDNLMETEYYIQPVYNNGDGKSINLDQFARDVYFKNAELQNNINDMMKYYRDSLQDAVEMNPNVQLRDRS